MRIMMELNLKLRKQLRINIDQACQYYTVMQFTVLLQIYTNHRLYLKAD